MTATPATPELLGQVRGNIRLKHYSIRAGRAYVDWIKRFILHFGKHHPSEPDAPEVEVFLTHLAVAGRVAAIRKSGGRSWVSGVFAAPL